MPFLTRSGRRTAPAATTDAARRRTEIRWGVAGIGAILVLVAALGVVAATGTASEHTYTAELTRADAVRPGDDVRIAGIPVGKVKALTLLRDRVRMTFSVADGVFLGDRTTLDVRMLTVVGGYYIAAEPAGTAPLGSKVIPPQRVTTPYNLTQAFQDAVTPVREVDGDTLRKNLAALAGSIGNSPDALRAAIRAADDLVAIMNKQNADISATLSIADDYLTALDANAGVLGQLIGTLHALENIVENNKTQISRSLSDLATVLHDATPLGRAWDETLRQRARPLADAVPKLEQLGTGMNALLDSLRGLEQRLLPYLPPGGGVTVDQSAATIAPPAICVPIPGGSC
ncbi:MlaD family protein [Nocardia aurantia]|uniref:Mce/MlaD domain-containing protein n=1 Tax=Nocardia aurantia TaxID=2585199 RepID=A0A7K0DK05_9NOCA|nr:MlaD family protein [Nocardia aurantia]MQY25921.1 hypothetical protein [Nocardia aurantia]